MFAKERQAKIVDYLHIQGTATTAELTKLFEVSAETVRRDFLDLERKGLLTRVHGGAMIASKMKEFADLTHRVEDNKENKIELCEIAMQFVKDGDIIAIDCGSTAIYFADAVLKRQLKLTVITHSADVFDILSNDEKINVILCGGQYLKKERAFYGAFALNTMSQIHVSKAFIFPSAISVNNGVSDFNQDLALMQKEMLHSCDKVYILADSDKFEKCAFIKLCDMSFNHMYVTDTNLSLNYKKLYENAGYTIINSKREK